MRVIFMGTPGFAVPALQALIGSAHAVAAVYSQPPRPAGRGMKVTPSPVHALAEQAGIPVFTPTSLKSVEAQQEFAALNADVAVVAAYGLLLPQAILDAPRLGCINIHPSDLPRWRGAAPIQRTILAGDARTACCIMQMDAGLDTGPVLARVPYDIAAGTTTGMLHDAMAALGARMVLEVLGEMEKGKLHVAPQAIEGVTYAAKMSKADQPIRWAQAGRQVYQQVLGLSPVPGAVAVMQGEAVKIFAAALEAGDASLPPGQVLDDKLLVNTGDGTAIRLLELQRPNRARQAAGAFLQGFSLPTGTRLGDA